MKKALSSILVASGMAFGLTFSFALAQQQPDFEEYFQNLAEQQGYSVSNRNANGEPPFTTPLNILPEVTTGLEPTNQTLVAATSADVVTAVNAMRESVNPSAGNINGTKAVGLHSGMVIKKNNNFEPRDVRNYDRLGFAPNPTLHNISWYPYSDNTVGFRMETGKFRMGSMPLNGRAFLDVPLANIFTSVEDDGDYLVKKLWFKARVDKSKPKEQRTSPLDGFKNAYKVYLVGIDWSPVSQVPILEFYGYFIYDIQPKPNATVAANQVKGDWKVKLIIDSDMIPDTASNGYPGILHPKLDLKIYSQGKALQN